MKTTKQIALAGLFTSLLVIANTFTIQIIPPYFVMSLVLTISFIVGLFLGPIKSFIVCILADLIGCLIHPLGPYNVLVGLSSGIIGLIFGFIKKIEKPNVLTVINLYILVTLICTCFLNTMGLWLMYAVGKKTFFAYLSTRLPWQLITSGINCSLSMILFKIVSKTKANMYLC